MLDRHAEPGGHWVDSYEFVKLHQPAAFYGVASEILEEPGDQTELASGARAAISRGSGGPTAPPRTPTRTPWTLSI